MNLSNFFVKMCKKKQLIELNTNYILGSMLLFSRLMFMNKEFDSLTDDILNNQEFLKLGKKTHHGITRFDHSLRVATYTYKVTKFLGLNYVDATRGALLHDFFIDEVENRNSIERLREHPLYALENSKKYFLLNDVQEDIIVKHMFPVTFQLPKYLESWIVDFIDDIASIYERCFSTRWKLLSNYNFILLVIIGVLK